MCVHVCGDIHFRASKSKITDKHIDIIKYEGETLEHFENMKISIILHAGVFAPFSVNTYKYGFDCK